MQICTALAEIIWGSDCFLLKLMFD